jgi:hypothetical protein
VLGRPREPRSIGNGRENMKSQDFFKRRHERKILPPSFPQKLHNSIFAATQHPSKPNQRIR